MMTTQEYSAAPRVIVQQWISLDGRASGPTDETEIMNVVDEDTDARSQEYNMGFLADVTSIMLGSVTYRKFVDYWPTANDPIASRVNEIPKFVASRTITAAPWGDQAPATVVTDAVQYVQDFHAERSRTLVIWGSLRLMTDLLAADQIDELDLFIAPIWLGAGTRILEADSSMRLRQTASEDWGTVTHLRYELADRERA